MRRLCLFVLASFFLFAADAPKPKPLTAEQRAEALAAALATSTARQDLIVLEMQYRTLQQQKNAALQKAEALEAALIEKLKADHGAKDCSLNEKAEWKCEAPKPPVPDAAKK